MRKFYEAIVDHKKTVIVFFTIAMIISALCSTMVNVNYDINDYLPDGTASTVALDKMNEEYDMSIPNARVMVSNLTVAEALKMKEKLSEIDGVDDVTWLDDAIDTDIPLETADKDTVENYYKDNNALYTVTIDESKRIETVHAIRDLIGEENSMSGAAGAKDFGSLNHLLVGTTVIIVILVLKQFKGFLNDSSILIGIIVGYILAICLGMVDFTQVKESAWFSLPHPMVVPFEFNIQAIIAMGIMFIATTVETIGDISGITNGGLDREPTNRELSGGVMADGIGSIVASIFGVLPNTSFSQNVGLVTVTKIVNRFVIMTGAIFLILCGFCPKLSAIFSVMPQSVLGGAAVIMFSMILVSGLQSLSRETLDGRNGLIVALAIGIGVGIGNVPEVLAQCPEWVSNIFAQNGIIMTFVVATVLNLILPRNNEEAKKEQMGA